MRTTFLALTALAGTGLLAGCQASRLEPRTLSVDEARWAETLKRWYPGWVPPYLSPLRKPASQTPEDCGSGPDVETVPASERDPDLPDTPVP